MRVLPTIAVAALLASPLSHAADNCQYYTWMDISAEDLSIMASVRPQAPASRKPVVVLNSVGDAYGRMGDEDLAQIRSVQPEGEKIIVCQTNH
jgi:hypothetical protein